MTEIVKINPADYGLTSEKANQVSKMFKPMLDKMSELETEFNSIVNQDVTPDLCKQAKTLRLKYVKVRTGTSAIHKELKSFYLQGGRFVDGWKNAQLMASQGNEEALMKIEKHFENIERERIAKIEAERTQILHDLDVMVLPDNLGTMDETVWRNFRNGAQMSFDQMKEAARKAEEERLQKEEEERQERERIRLENERLKKEAAEREAKIEAERKERERLEAIERERAAEAERERLAKERAAREKLRARIEEERKEKERIQAEIRKKEEAERKAKEEEEKRIQAELNKGDSDKVSDLISDLNLLKAKYQFKSKDNQAKFRQVTDLIDRATQILNS